MSETVLVARNLFDCACTLYPSGDVKEVRRDASALRDEHGINNKMQMEASVFPTLPTCSHEGSYQTGKLPVLAGGCYLN